MKRVADRLLIAGVGLIGASLGMALKTRGAVGEGVSVEAAQADWRRFAAVLDDHMDGREWLVGSSPTVADFAVAAALPWAKASNIPLAEFTNVLRWHDRMNTMPAWREGFPALADA